MNKVNIKKSLKYMSIALIVIIITLFLTLKIRDTFAYFVNGETQETSVNITTGLFDNLDLKVGKETLTISGTTASDATTAKAILTANDETNKATDNYYFYINITQNNFTYTSSAKTAELVLTITKPDGNKLTSLEGFKYVTVGSVSGFDVTESTDLIKVVENKSISATSANNNTTTEEWGITLTAINPSQNSGKTFEANVILQEEKINLFADHIKSLYTTDGVNNLYLHDNKYKDEANDGSYRFSGANPQNYICFGSNAESCPTDNLYRIIGVFGDQVKIIKNNSIGKYRWSGSSSVRSKYWRDSELNTKILNGTFLNSLMEWGDLVSTSSWKVGGATYTPGKDAQNYFNEEVDNSDSSLIVEQKIGLMYLSDYGFSADASDWYQSMYYYGNSDIAKNNWLYYGEAEWTITNEKDSSQAFYINSSGGINNDSVYSRDFVIRPALYLKASVKYDKGTGTHDDPYRIL